MAKRTASAPGWGSGFGVWALTPVLVLLALMVRYQVGGWQAVGCVVAVSLPWGLPPWGVAAMALASFVFAVSRGVRVRVWAFAVSMAVMRALIAWVGALL